MRDSFESDFGGLFLLADLSFKFLLLSRCLCLLFLLFLAGSWCLTLSGTLGSFSLLLLFLWLGCRLATRSLHGDLLFLSPELGHFDLLEKWDSINIVLDANSEFGGGCRVISFRSLAGTDIILCDCIRETIHERSALAVVDLESKASYLVIEFELLYEWELLTDLEEVCIVLSRLGLTRLRILELVVDSDWQVIVIVHSEVLHCEMRSHHSTVERSTSSDALSGVEGALKFLLLENLLDDCLNDWGTGAITNKFDKIDLLRGQAGEGNNVTKESGKLADLRVNELLEFFSLELSGKIFLIHEVIDVDVGLSITTEKLSSLLDGLVQSQSRSNSFTRVTAVLGIELFT